MNASTKDHQVAAAGSETGASATPEAPRPSSETLIEPVSGWPALNLAELWRFRELLWVLAWRDVKVRYKQTALGAAWAAFQPLMLMAVFSLVFSHVAGSPGGVPYPVFVFAGLLPWTFFAGSTISAGNSVTASEHLIAKVYFPRLVIPFAAVVANLIDCLVACGVLVVLMLAWGVRPTWGLLLLPALVALVALAALAFGILLAALNAVYRDVRHVVPFLMQLWMFATPAIYLPPADEAPAPEAAAVAAELPGRRAALPAGADPWLRLNPMTGLVTSFRAAAVGGPIPWAGLGIAVAEVGVVFLAGCLYFRRVEDSFADIL
jgi:lipopolysaccharide transport system permease protein